MTNSRNLLLSVAIACLALLAAALYLQHGMDMLPCPYCVIQRYLFLGIALGCLFGTVINAPKFGASLGLLSALGGLGAAGKHLYILDHPGLSCGIDPMETMLNKVFTAEYLPFIFRADGLCEDATAPLLGLSVPMWSFGFFAIFAVTLIWVLVRRK